jgi:tetratricopeptide (TPR) repeat protein/S1-C subfamily serine protease
MSKPIAILSSIFFSTTILTTPIIAAPGVVDTLAQVTQGTPEVTQTVQRFTVQVITDRNRGSGTLLAKKKDKTFLVLTNLHVIRGSQTAQIKTFDGQLYTAKILNNRFSTTSDLALVEFTSTKDYEVPEIGTATPQVGWSLISGGYAAQSGKFQNTNGQLKQIASQTLKEGYQLGYSGTIEQGMSGGPVFETEDQILVGINGRTAFPITPNYTYEDGTIPNKTEIEQMQKLNWGIPIQQVLAQIQPEIFTAYQLPPPIDNLDIQSPKLSGWIGDLESKAKQITVRIDSSSGSNGSGVIIAKKGNTYTILTSSHVICEKNEGQPNCKNNSYKIVTHDGQQYDIQPSSIKRQEGVDLAIVNFKSEQSYLIATLSDYSHERGYIFVTGYSKNTSNNTPKWMFSTGKIHSKYNATIQVNNYNLACSYNDSLPQTQATFRGGYKLVYSNITFPGMSGGAVLDWKGQLVGIHGLAEGIIGNGEEKIQLDNSLGVPISTFLDLAHIFNVAKDQLSLRKDNPNSPTENQEADLSAAMQSFAIPKGNASARAWIERGNQLLRIERYADAKAAFDQAIQLNPSFVHLAWFGKALVAFSQEQDDGTFDTLYKIQLENPGYTSGFQSSKSFKTLEILLKIKPDYLPALRLLTAFYSSIGQDKKALSVVDKAIQKQYDNKFQNLNLYLDKWKILRRAKHSEEALKTINKLIAISPCTDFYSERGDYLYSLGSYSRSILDANKVITFDPRDSGAYVTRGMANFRLNEYAKALSDLKKAISINPSRLNYSIQEEYNYLMMIETGFEDESKTILNNPKNAQAYNNRGYILASLQKYSDALSDFNKAITLDSKLDKAFLNRANLYLALGQHQKAILDYGQALILDPQDSLAYVGRGHAYLSLKQPEKAVLDYNKALSIRPKEYSAINNIGLIQYEKGTIDSAITQFKKVLELDNTIAESKLALAVALNKNGNSSKALELAKASLLIEQRLVEPEFLRKNLWGEKLIADTRKLLSTPALQTYLQELNP